MEENNVKSLLNDDNVSLLDTEFEDLDNSVVIDSATTDYEKDVAEQKRAQEKEETERKEREAMLRRPEVQAQIVAENYIKNSTIYLNTRERKKIYRDCLKKAKQGVYKSYFIPEFIAKREARERAKIEKLNSNTIHTEKDLSPDVKAELLKMANIPDNEVPKAE